MVLNRSQVKRPVLPQQVEPCEPLGGDVIVRGMLHSERMATDELNIKAAVPLEGETEEEARARAGRLVVPRTLHVCVVDDEGQSVLTEREWDTIGATHQSLVFNLFFIALRLSGRDPEAIQKN